MHRKTRGFTLIEILMALMVLSIGLASVLAVFVTGVRASREVVDDSAAALSARAVLARVLSQDANGDGHRDLLKVIVDAYSGSEKKGFIWLRPSDPFVAPDGSKAYPLAEDATNSLYFWRCRASSYREDITKRDPMQDGAPLYENRYSEDLLKNEDTKNELWRLTLEIYRAYKVRSGVMDVEDVMPLATYQTYVCTAHK